jgi:uncharacterized membrane protein (UPF0127 family)
VGTFRRLIAAVIACLLFATGALARCQPDRVDLRGEFGTVRFSTELALTHAEQMRGLMHREELPRLASMLFIYPRSAERSFWMRNTLIPLDIVFLDDAGKITHIHADARPLDETLIPSGGPARAALEINGGLAAELGLAVGDELRSPAMPQDDAAWPCD